MKLKQAKYPGIPQVIHGNGAVAYVMSHVCGGVIGYPITPSTEIAEIYEAFRAEGGVNVWGKHPFFFEPEGEHSAQSGALGATLTGGQFISNASSSQGILYALESHYVTVGKKVGGFVLQVAARVVSKHSLNVMAGHDDVYALLSSGYTILFGSNPQQAADLAAISYRASSLSLIPVANAMDGFSTSHMMSEALMPEPELLAEYLGDPAGRIAAPTLAQEILFGSKGRVVQLTHYLSRHQDEIAEDDLAALWDYLERCAAGIEKDNQGALLADTYGWLPEALQGPWRRQWLNAFEKGTRQLVPAQVDVNNPGLTGPVQNQPDFQAGSADHRTHFVAAVPALVRQAMAEYSALTGRSYTPVHTFMCEDAETVMIGLGSVTDDVEAVVSHLRSQGRKVGVISIKLLQPFPEAEVVAALKGKKAVTVLERSEQTALTALVTQALFKGRENADGLRHPDIPAIGAMPRLTTAIFGLGGHDLQPRHLIAAFQNMDEGNSAPLIYLGSQFFSKNSSIPLVPRMAELEQRLRTAYPETVLMALDTAENPRLLPDSAFRVRFHSVGGYGTIASGKLLTDILAGVLEMHSKSAPKYGSEKSGAPTNFYITLSPEPIKITNAELEEVEVVISPDHRAFSHTNPLRGLVEGGTFIMQSSASAEAVWAELPPQARQTIRDRKINFLIIDAFAVAKKHAPTPGLATRMMGIAFIGAVAGHVRQVSGGASPQAILDKVRKQIAKKFGSKGSAVVEGNMAVIREGVEATRAVDYQSAAMLRIDARPAPIALHNVSLSASMCQPTGTSASGCSGLFDRQYFEDMIARPFREGTIAEAPVLPGIGLFMPAGSAGAKDKGLFRRAVPIFNSERCTGCMECALVCPDAAIPNTVHEIHELLLAGIGELPLTEVQREAMRGYVPGVSATVREAYRQSREPRPFHELVAAAAEKLPTMQHSLLGNFSKLVDLLSNYPVSRTRPFFDAMEKDAAGSGGLFSVTIDPWKCTGCLECVDLCGPGALMPQEQDAALLGRLQNRFDFMSKTPNTPARFVDGALEAGGEIKRLLLDRANYYSTTGGHGGCRGCGEVTAIRLVMATNHAITNKRRHDHLAELESLIAALHEKQAALTDGDRVARIGALIATLEKRLYLYESGPTGNGPSGTVIANSTGCSSVYASTFPFNAYKDPWDNSLLQDAQPLAKGLFEGIAAQTAGDIRALRLARLELDDAYASGTHDQALRNLSWSQFSRHELGLMPTVMTIGGDGATYDIGFGALSRILASDTPLKVLVLNTGAYSNTGGQASTSSFIAQDSDLARIGAAASGKHEARKELGLIASFHSNVFVCSTSTALQNHFLKNTMEFLTYTDSPAVLDVYTPCQGEHGIADDISARQSRLAVDSRMNPVFVHDPRRGKTLHEWFSLEGNPDPELPWSRTTLDYLDDDDTLQQKTMALTPAHFAFGEIRFKKQFHRLPTEASDPLAIEAFVELSAAQRVGKTPFIYATDSARRLVRMGFTGAIVALVEERQKYWTLLQYLAGLHVERLSTEHRAAINSLQARYQESVQQHDRSLDGLARAMSELATVSPARPGQGPVIPIVPVSGAAAGAPVMAGGTTAALEEPPVTYDRDDQIKCTNCKTCYQDLPELFEKTRIVVNGESREVAQLISGALERVVLTPELKARIQRVAANCDAEIIR